MRKDILPLIIWLSLTIVFFMMAPSAYGAPTNGPRSQFDDVSPDPVLPESITYNITETYRGDQMTKELVCDENPHGTHPTPKEACDEIKELALHGDDSDPVCICPKILDPVSADIRIFIEDYAIGYQIAFDNTCTFHCKTKPLRKFFNIGLVPDDQEWE